MTVRTTRHEANDAAQRAFRRMLEHHLRTGEWNTALVADYAAAEHAFDELPEFMLDALHEATHAELTELADAEGLPDVPLAAIPWCEQWQMDGNR